MKIFLRNCIKKENATSFCFILLIIMLFYSNNAHAQKNHFLLLDERIIENTKNAKLTVGTVEKHAANPLFVEDNLWEKRFDNLYGNVIYDKEEKIYKCWYSPFIVDSSALGMSLVERDSKKYRAPWTREMAICYASSKDGITWEKPEMGLVEFEGSKANNILWRGISIEDSKGDREWEKKELWSGPHGSGVFKDFRDPDPKRRYKAIIKMNILSVAFSEDGIHWGDAIACPEADVAGDTHNNAFWAPTLNKYVGITRSWGNEKGRQVVRTESEDFLKWTESKLVLEGIDKNHQTYAMPVFYYGGVYIGLVAIHQQDSDRVWTELTWSPDTKNWYRIDPGTPLIPCSDKVLDYDYGCVYPCAYPVFLENEIRLYYGGSDYLHFGWRNGSLCLATLRPDGFAGYEQVKGDEPAILTTASIPYEGKPIQITADVNEGGSVKVSVVDKKGNTVAESAPLIETVTDKELSFDENIKLENVQLKFELVNSKLYSFRFAE
jgi:hypothetical protein